MRRPALFYLAPLCSLMLSMPAVGAEDFAIEVLAGRAKHEASLGLFQPKVDDHDTSIGIRGTYQLNKYLGFDLSYNDFGKVSGSSIDDAGNPVSYSLKGSALELNFNGRVFIIDRLSLIARLGASRTNSDVSIGADSKTNHSFAWVAGVGIQYWFLDRFFTSVDYSKRDLSGGELLDFNFSTHDVTNLTVSLGYRF